QHLSRPVVILVFALVSLAVLFDMFCDFGLIDYGNRGVMNHATVTWQHLGSLYPLVLLKIRGDVNIFVVVLRSSLHHVFRDREYHVRFDVPARSRRLSQRRAARTSLGLAAFGSSFHPRVDGSNLLVRQSGIVVEFAECGISMPRRHLTVYDVF